MGSIGTTAAVNTFKKLAQIPQVSSAEIERADGEAYDVQLTLSGKSYATMAKTRQQCYVKVSAGQAVSSSTTPAVDVSIDSIKGRHTSLPGSQANYTVVLREASGKAGKVRRFVGLWRDERCYKSAEVTEHHGAFVDHENYGSLSVYQDTVLYSAEANPPEKQADIAARKDGGWPTSWDYLPGLGEQTGDLVQPTVFLLRFRLETEEEPQLSRLAVDSNESDTILSSAIFGQAVFSSTGKEILLTAYSTIQDGRRLGLIYCTTKPSAVYKASIDEHSGVGVGDKEADNKNAWIPRSWTRLSLPGHSARSPRAIEGEKDCLWLQCEEGGAHVNCDSLASFSKDQVTIEIPVVSIPDESTGWAGLYCGTQLAKSCLLRNGSIFVADTILGCSRVILLYALGSGLAPTILTPEGGDIDLKQSEKERSLLWSYKLLCTDGDSAILAVRSSPLHPEQVLIGTLAQGETKVKWDIIRDLGAQWRHDKEIQRMGELQCSIEEFAATKSETKGDQAVQTIVIQDASRLETAPCFLLPHGGPHGNVLTQWSAGTAALGLAGYTLAAPNYHGSLGRGQQYISSLIGQCGSLDVKDCLTVIEQLIERRIADKGKLYIMGGSHGGFLTAHLIGKYPSLFQAAIVRNPVIAVGQMEATSDIPEWCYSEFGFPFNFHDSPPLCPTTSQYEQMQAMSPVQRIDAIQTPLLILLGLKDQRVPPSQGKMLYHRLLAKGKKVKMLAFENDHHALDGVEAELISWEATLRWCDSM